MRNLALPLLAAALCLPAVARDSFVLTLSKDGGWKEVKTPLSAIRLTTGGKSRTIPLRSILSIHNGAPASAAESEKITAGIARIQGPDRGARDAAVEELTAIGLPVATPLLDAYKDTLQQEPRPLYRLFERILPSRADTYDRTLSLVRLTDGTALRGLVEPFSASGVEWDSLRLLAVRQDSAVRTFSVHSIRHSTQIEYFDTGLTFGDGAVATLSAGGFTRLAFAVDGWASDPDGLKKPGPNYKTNLVDGHPFGALVGRFGSSGSVFFAGRSWTAPAGSKGRLQLAINDNRHWQNNLGSYQVTVTAKNVYDLADAQ